MNFDGTRFNNVPKLEKIIFDDGWESIQGYVFFAITSTVDITIPKGVTAMSATIFVNEGSINMFFDDNCPKLLDGDKFNGNVVIHYNPDTYGWDTTPLRESHTLIPN